MNWSHMGLACSTEKNADRFFVMVLGLEKSEPKALPCSVSEGLFGLCADLSMIYYSGDGLQFEVFIVPERPRSNDSIIHACIEVADRAVLLERCEAHDVEVLRVRKGDSLLTFVRDYDGNLFEIKQARGC